MPSWPPARPGGGRPSPLDIQDSCCPPSPCVEKGVLNSSGKGGSELPPRPPFRDDGSAGVRAPGAPFEDVGLGQSRCSPPSARGRGAWSCPAPYGGRGVRGWAVVRLRRRFGGWWWLG